MSRLQIEALLDETTAELAKLEFSPLCSTIEANFKLKKAVPLHITVRMDAKVGLHLLQYRFELLLPCSQSKCS